MTQDKDNSVKGGLIVYFSMVAVSVAVLAYGYFTVPHAQAMSEATNHAELAKPQY